MTDILNIGDKPYHDGSIIQKQWHTYSPFTSSFKNDDEIRIAIQSQDLYIQPAESYLLLEVQFSHIPGVVIPANSQSIFGCLTQPFLFSEARYELNGTEIDRSKNVGLTSTLKRMTATRLRDKQFLESSGAYNHAQIVNGTYQFFIPLYSLFGFAEDYNKIILNAKHELVLVRSRTDVNLYHTVNANQNPFAIKLIKIQWRVPHVTLSDRSKLRMLKYIERQRTINVAYRTWDLYEMPALPQTNRHIWPVKTTNHINKPRYVVVAFQTNRKDNFAVDATKFDHCNLSDVKLFLNTSCYPYDNMNLDFNNDFFMEAHMALIRMQNSYYNGAEASNPYGFTAHAFKEQCLFAFDCSRSDDSLLNSSVDVRIEITARQNIPANTAAYCLIISDTMFEYSPFHGIVNKRS